MKRKNSISLLTSLLLAGVCIILSFLLSRNEDNTLLVVFAVIGLISSVLGIIAITINTFIRCLKAKKAKKENKEVS